MFDNQKSEMGQIDQLIQGPYMAQDFNVKCKIFFIHFKIRWFFS